MILMAAFMFKKLKISAFVCSAPGFYSNYWAVTRDNHSDIEYRKWYLLVILIYWCYNFINMY